MIWTDLVRSFAFSLVRILAMTAVVDFNINADTPSRPVDLAGFNE